MLIFSKNKIINTINIISYAFLLYLINFCPNSYSNFTKILEFLNSILSLMDDQPSPGRFWFGNKLYIGVYEPEQIKVRITNKDNVNTSLLAHILLRA